MSVKYNDKREFDETYFAKNIWKWLRHFGWHVKLWARTRKEIDLHNWDDAISWREYVPGTFILQSEISFGKIILPN